MEKIYMVQDIISDGDSDQVTTLQANLIINKGRTFILRFLT